MNYFKAIADEDIQAGDAVTFDPITGRVRKLTNCDLSGGFDKLLEQYREEASQYGITLKG